MNHFVRQLAVLSVLWSLCELLMPQGRQQLAVRMTMAVFVMTALMSSVGALLGQPAHWPAWTERTGNAAQQSYQRTYLRVMANQVENYCVRQAQKAGYEAAATVWLNMDGGLEGISLRLQETERVLMSRKELVQHLTQMLEAGSECIQLEEP